MRQLAAQLKGRIPIIAVGGVMRAEDAAQKLAAGASLVQLYTGLVYGGPRLVRDCVRRLPAEPGYFIRTRIYGSLWASQVGLDGRSQ